MRMCTRLFLRNFPHFAENLLSGNAALHSLFDRIRDSRDLDVSSTHAHEVFVSRNVTADRNIAYIYGPINFKLNQTTFMK